MNQYRVTLFIILAGILLLLFTGSAFAESDGGEVYPTGTMEYMFTMRALGTVFPTRTMSATATDSPTPTDIASALPTPDPDLPLLKSSSPFVKQEYRQIVPRHELAGPGIWLNNDTLFTIISFDDQPFYINLKEGTEYTHGALYAPGVPQVFIDTMLRDGYGKIRYIFRSPSGNRMLIFRDSQTHPDTYAPWPYDLWFWEKGKGTSVLFTAYSWIYGPAIIPYKAAWSSDESLFFFGYAGEGDGYSDGLINLKNRTSRGIVEYDESGACILKNAGARWPSNFTVSPDGRLVAYDQYEPGDETSRIAVVSINELESKFYNEQSLPFASHVIPRRSTIYKNGKNSGTMLMYDRTPITWGADSVSLFFSDEQENGEWAVFRYDLKTKQKSIWMTFNDVGSALGQKGEFVSAPMFSPDGKRFALPYGNYGENLSIFEETEF